MILKLINSIKYNKTNKLKLNTLIELKYFHLEEIKPFFLFKYSGISDPSDTPRERDSHKLFCMSQEEYERKKIQIRTKVPF